MHQPPTLRHSLLLLVLLTACDETSDEAIEQVETPAEDPSKRAIAFAPEAPQQANIGWSTPPTVPSDASQSANSAGLAALKKGQVDSAIASFERTTTDHQMGRFNLACAYSRKGELEKSASIVAELLRANLPQFYERLEKDADLQALRDSDAGKRLADYAQKTLATYREVAKGGDPLTFQYGVEKTKLEGGAQGYTEKVSAQAGVWLASVGRFIPAGPIVRVSGDETSDARLATTYDPQSGYVASVTASDPMPEGEARLENIEAFVVEAFTAKAVLSLSRKDDQPSTGEGTGVELWLGKAAAKITVGGEEKTSGSAADLRQVLVAKSFEGAGPILPASNPEGVELKQAKNKALVQV